MRLHTFLVFSAAITICCATHHNKAAERWMGTPVNVSYDHRALLINGERQLLVSGSIHYPRSTPGMWNDLFQKSKAAGIDVIETYVFWNLHQSNPLDFNFEGNADIMTFLKLAQQNNLWVNLRIGPYICGEWNFGGFPEWLKEEKGMVFRTYNEPFMDAMATFMTRIVDLLSPMFAPNGGPIIMAQVENEYSDFEKVYGINGTRYAEWAIEFAQSLGIGVPWIMCEQDNVPQAINTCNGFYCDSWIQKHFATFPDQPAFWTENWPGWFQAWTAPKTTRPTEDIAFATAKWFAKGGTMQNYYMWQGGTNFGRTAGGPGVTTSYDYDVALDEYGLPHEPKYSHSAKLHDVLHQYQDALLYNEIPNNQTLGPLQEAYVYGNGSNSIAFLINSDPNNTASVTFRGQNYQLLKWSASLVNGDGDVLYNTATITSAETKALYSPVAAPFDTSATWFAEPVGPWGGNVVSSEKPLEQISVTHDTSDYLWYVTKISVDQSGTFVLNVSDAEDYFYIFFDDQLVAIDDGLVSVSANEGTHLIQVLVMTLGLVNYKAHMEEWTRGLLGNVTWNNEDITANGWVMQPGLLGEFLQVYTTTGSGVVSWNQNLKQANMRPLTWFKSEFDFPNITNDNGPYALDLVSMGKGFAWINGNNLGRYFINIVEGNCGPCNYAGPFNPNKCNIGCGEPSQRYYHVPADWLLPENNLLVLFEEKGGNPLEVRLVQVSKTSN